MINVFDPDKNEKFESSEASGSFSVESKQNGLYDICFNNKGRTLRSITLNLKNSLSKITNIEENNLVKKEHLEPLQQQFQEIIDSAKHLTSDIKHLKQREWELRDINELTNSRVFTFSFISITVFIGVGLFKIYYLKNFFTKKKLI